MNLHIQDLNHGVTYIDTLYIRPGLACCYLLEHNGKAAFIDTGTTYTTPRLLDLLSEKGFPQKMLSMLFRHMFTLTMPAAPERSLKHCPTPS